LAVTHAQNARLARAKDAADFWRKARKCLEISKPTQG